MSIEIGNIGPAGAPGVGARAWVNFNGTGTTGQNQTIRGSSNVASVFKNGNGDYTINFATALANANYAAVVSGRGAATATRFFMEQHDNPAHSTTSLRIYCLDASYTPADCVIGSVVIFGD